MPGTHAPDRIESERLLLRRPVAADADAIFSYASDPDVTRYVGWPRHTTLEETRAFLAFSDAQWATHPAGPYVIVARGTATVVGSTGLMFESPRRAGTGYVLAKAAWGRGFATEALLAMVAVARGCGVERLYALCHHAHRASARVLEKGGFALEGTLRRYLEFPNLDRGETCDVCCYSRIFEISSGTEGKMRS